MILIPFDVPLDPDAEEARELLLTELAKPEYQAAKPTLFDQIAQAFFDWLQSLTFPVVDGGPPVGLIVFAGVIIAVIAIAFLVYGVPRLNRRSSVTGELFGEDDQRDAAQIRRDAARAAKDGDWSLAIAEQYRAIARALSERTVVTVSPGTTAHDFARRATIPFPAESESLSSAAVSFDGVRYLDRPGSRDQWDALVALDTRLGRSRAANLVSTLPESADAGSEVAP